MNSKRIEMQAAFCLKHLSHVIFAIRRQSIDIRQHRIQFEQLSSFTSNSSLSSSFITACRSRENSSIFETIKILKCCLIEMREIREVMSDETTRKEHVKTKELSEKTLTLIWIFSWMRFWSWASRSNQSNFICAQSYFFNRTSMSFMFESSTISIIWKIVIETITKATKIVIETIKKKFASNENDNNWRSIFNNVALSIEAKTIETTINESITNRWDIDSNWDFDLDWRSNLNASARSFLNINESRDAKIFSLFIFWARNLRSRLTISLREKAEIFVSRLNRRFVMFKKKC
jgi:hypothetical protein